MPGDPEFGELGAGSRCCQAEMEADTCINVRERHQIRMEIEVSGAELPA